MAQATYTARVIVLRKTKLGESDLILTFLLENGSQVRAVAKGARKPTSSFATRLDLYSIADVLVATGRNLDIVKEVRLVQSNERLRSDFEYTVGAAPMAELLERITQTELEDTQLFALTQTAFECLGRVETSQVPVITAAHLLKALAFAGLRPSFEQCVGCGQALVRNENGGRTERDDRVAFSFREGGVLCDRCAQNMNILLEPRLTIDWCRALLGSTFADIEQMAPGAEVGLAALHFCQEWIHEHVGTNLKSLNFLFTCGLF